MRFTLWLPALALLAVGVASCAPGRLGRRDSGGVDPGEDGGISSGCSDSTDVDMDGIADQREGEGDTDGDGIPNVGDTDSDGDGLSDFEESGGGDPCAPRDSDGDGIPDAFDTDSDNDGIPDSEEVAGGTNPYTEDSDGDGFSDLVERAAGTDPSDAGSRIPETDFAVVLPYNGEHVPRMLRFGTNINQADVYFLVDMTGSMGGERSNLITGLVDVIIPGIQAEISNVQFGAAGFDDYPYSGYGSSTPGTVGPGADRPFYLLREIAPGDADLGGWSTPASAGMCPAVTGGSPDGIGSIAGGPNGRPDILEAVEGLPCHYGADYAESYVPALFASATGMGLTWPSGMVPARSCPTIPDEVGTRRGYPCFRPGSLPIILIFGDAPFHNGPPGTIGDAYAGFTAPSWAETVAALDGLGARVLGIYSGTGDAIGDYNALATATGAVRADGSPLVFTISADGSGLSRAVVDAVLDLVGGTPQDVDTTTENVMGNPDNFDATLFIKSIVPLEGYRDGLSGPMPGVTYTSKDTTTFYQVIPGTAVEFTIDFWNDVRPPAETAQVFRCRIVVMGNGVARLDEREVYIVVPPEGYVIII